MICCCMVYFLLHVNKEWFEKQFNFYDYKNYVIAVYYKNYKL